jgi:hypothetical protein
VAAPLPVLKTDPFTSVESITPAVAGKMLVANRNNRSLRKQLVERYARDMQAGRWQFTGEAIKFGADGELLDGQHRLAAIVKADVPVTMLVIRDLERDAQDVMDTGTKRTPADVLRLRGESGGNTLAAVAKMIYTDGARTNERPTTAELINIVETDETLRWIVDAISSGDLYSLRRITSPAVVGYAYWRLHQIDAFAAAEFFAKLATLVNLPAGSPILALHRRLSAHERKSDGRNYRRESLAYIFMTWNAWRKGENRSLVKLAYSQGQISVPDPK